MPDNRQREDDGRDAFSPAISVHFPTVDENEAAAGKGAEMRWAPRPRRPLLLRKRLAFIRSLRHDDARFVRFVHKLLRLLRIIEKVNSPTETGGPFRIHFVQ